mgnify:FL=1
MKIFQCQNCGLAVYFENTVCERCGSRLGFLPDTAVLSALTDNGEGTWRPLGGEGAVQRFCANADHEVCNWLVPAGSPSPFCVACAPNRTIPDLSEQQNLQRWRKLEAAKRRLVYSLLRLGLPIQSKSEGVATGLAFELIADTDPDAPVLTGHADGLITINIAEADDAEREARRSAMGEPYRTLLGHFRHEVGHYYWDRLVRDAGLVDAFRAIFGDETRDYSEALSAHYANGPQPDWQARYVSAYASSHPWEDFSETWAHYLHIVDALETADAFGLQTRPGVADSGTLTHIITFDPYSEVPFTRIIDAWLPLTYAVNSLNRSIGQPDFYPFVLARPAIDKLEFVHRLVHGELQG